MSREINGRLVVRVAMGYDGLAALQQQLTRLLAEVTRTAATRDGGS